MKAYPLLVIGAVVFLLFAFGKIDLDFWAYTEREASATQVPVLSVPRVEASAGEG